MRKFVVIQFSVLAIVSGVATWLTFLAGGIAAYHWTEVFYGEEVPRERFFMMHYGFLIPLICCLSSIICIFVSMKKRGDLLPLWKLFTFIVVVEIIGLAFISCFNISPALRIMYRLM